MRPKPTTLTEARAETFSGPVPLRMLIVEDSEDDAELVRLELEKAGFRVESYRVQSEGDFVDHLDRGGWDLVVSDFRMPHFDGLRAFNLFRERNLDIPFLFVSGAMGEERAVKAMRAGARDYLIKGNLARLSEAVRREMEETANRRSQRSLQEAARRDHHRLAMAVEASGAGIFEIEVPAGPSSHYSERWAEILGFRKDELPAPEDMAEWTLERVHPEDRARFRQTFDDLFSGREPHCRFECRMHTRDDRWAEVEILAKLLPGTAGGRSRAVGVMLDFGERRLLENQLRQAQKMEAVGRLAGGVAHDFNNLLTVILSFASLALDELGADSPAHRSLEEILRAGRRAEELTAQLLAFSRQKPIAPRVVDLNGIVEEMDRLLRRSLGEDVELVTRLAAGLGSVRLDPASFEQVLLNLAINARDAMPGGGRLTLETAAVELDEEYGVVHGAAVAAGPYLRITVSDTGIGMDEATRNRIFEPFFTTKEPGKGTGLGLATCYGIVKQAGGFIWVYSEPGKGTTFKIYLPRSGGGPERRKRAEEPGSCEGSETVLVVDDNEPVRQLAGLALARLGYRVLEAGSAEQALELAAEPIDLLLTDVVMPGMGGEELARRLTSRQAGMKVLLMSGYSASTVLDRTSLPPGVAALEKPFTPRDLARKVRQVLDA